MTTISAKTRFTPDDLLELEREGRFELVGGRLIEKQMSSYAGRTVAQITIHLGNFLLGRNMGELFSETSFRCFPDDPEKIRRPDIAFIAADRLGGVTDEGHVLVAPDLIIEVISPGDRMYDVDARLADYFRAGVKLIWVVNPSARTIRVHRLDQTVTIVNENSLLSGENVLPGFSMPLRELMPEPLHPSMA